MSTCACGYPSRYLEHDCITEKVGPSGPTLPAEEFEAVANTIGTYAREFLEAHAYEVGGPLLVARGNILNAIERARAKGAVT